MLINVGYYQTWNAYTIIYTEEVSVKHNITKSLPHTLEEE